MRDLSAELKSLNADWDALVNAAESLDCGAQDVWTMLMIELRAARADTRLDDVLAEMRALRRVSASVLETLRRWDAEGLPPVRPADDDPPAAAGSASVDPRTPSGPGPAAADEPSAGSRPDASEGDPETKDRPE